MKYAYLLAVIGLLQASGLSAPPERCDDVPPVSSFPQLPHPRGALPSHDPYPSVAGSSRRQRLQSLKDRVNKLRSTIECPQPLATPGAGPVPAAQPPVAQQDSSPEEPPLVVATAPVPPEPAIPQSTHPVEPVPVPESPPETVAVPVPDPVSAPVPDPMLPAELEPQPLATPEILPLPNPESQPEPAPEPPLQVAPDPQLQPAPEVAVDPAPPESPQPLPHAPAEATPMTPPLESDVPPSEQNTPLALPTELLDQAIDRQRMGNNLYAIGAYELALTNYQKMLQQPLGQVETQWVNFQVANCQRHLGQTVEAQKAYRRVAAESSEEWLGQMSRWWLKELDDRDQLQRRVTELEQVIKTLEQEVSRAP